LLCWKRHELQDSLQVFDRRFQLLVLGSERIQGILKPRQCALQVPPVIHALIHSDCELLAVWFHAAELFLDPSNNHVIVVYLLLELVDLLLQLRGHVHNVPHGE